ncbi:3-phosphoshikimate 1-carboxyvinyltransferase [Rhodococcus tibetensis]|uniref:3-phosphoshikimate 1-carboxyvinyltransferase n=1 Tax=Rhodococcus tibetensis TaxID=2965064 RepID=A0ABT1QJ97_9NOCA|nr:hypothetical protein [Rhodococcus sp. FXJ9.536]MCQ4122374.1 hypothetical protein [Rhodococcus sp. FXJ9.536]
MSNIPSTQLFPSRTHPSDRIRLCGVQDQPGFGPLTAVPHPDKAISQRATIVAAAGHGVSRLSNLADCRDLLRNLDCLADLGVNIRPIGDDAVEIQGQGPEAVTSTSLTVDVDNSATTARLLTAMVAASDADVTITGNTALRRRPMAEVVGPLHALGADIVDIGPNGHLPIQVRGRPLPGGSARIDVHSAQPVSAALLAAALAQGPSVIHRRVAARDHTERLLRWVGVEVEETPLTLHVQPRAWGPLSLRIPGDPSGAAFLAAVHLASAHRERPLVLREVCINSRRTGFFRILRSMGAEVDFSAVDHDTPEELANITIRAADQLRGVHIDDPELVQSAIDELPMIAALATLANGETRIGQASELRGKDTDRIVTTVELLRQFGVQARPTMDGLHVRPTPIQAPAILQLPRDHRVIFAGIVLTVLTGGYGELHGLEAVATSYPNAINELRRWVVVEE